MEEFLKKLLDEKGPLTTDEICELMLQMTKDTLKQSASFQSVCKRTYKGNKKRVWVRKKESPLPEKEKDPLQQLLDSQQKSDSLNAAATTETFGAIPEGCEPFSLTCKKARETQKEFCKTCSCYQTCEACNKLK